MSKKDLDTAKYLLVNGFDGIPQSDEMLSSHDFHRLLLIKRAKTLIVESALKRGVKLASHEWGLSQNSISLLLNLSKSSSLVSDQSVQVCSLDFKQFSDNATMTREGDLDGDRLILPKKILRLNQKLSKYSNAQKIDACRRFVRYNKQSVAAKELSIPISNLLKWRDKIVNQLFQDPHWEILYCGKRLGRGSSFFKEIDDALYAWLWEQNIDAADHDRLIRLKAKQIARLDDREPIISNNWLVAFKKHHNL